MLELGSDQEFSRAWDVVWGGGEVTEEDTRRGISNEVRRSAIKKSASQDGEKKAFLDFNPFSLHRIGKVYAITK